MEPTRPRIVKARGSFVDVGRLSGLCFRKRWIVDSTVLRRFEVPDETRELVKGKFEVVHIGGMTMGLSDLRARLEMVGACGAWNRLSSVHGRARWARIVGNGDCSICRWSSHRPSRRSALSHPSGASRQLGGRKSALCIAPFSWSRRVCQVEFGNVFLPQTRGADGCCSW